MKKGSLTFEELKTLCIEYIDHYESKSGDDYVEALKAVLTLVNRNDVPFTEREIREQPTIQEFKLSGLVEFQYVCDLCAKPMIVNKIGEREANEKIVPTNFQSQKCKNIFEKSLGVAYLITCVINDAEHIIKIGQTRTPFVKRLQSYNCGTVNNRKSGTCSTTNFKLTQSFVTTRRPFKLYIRDCSDDKQCYMWSGIKSVPFSSSLSLAIEDIAIKEFIRQFGRPPLDNIQSGATEVDD